VLKTVDLSLHAAEHVSTERALDNAEPFGVEGPELVVAQKHT
jgi:hypothetical protein